MRAAGASLVEVAVVVALLALAFAAALLLLGRGGGEADGQARQAGCDACAASLLATLRRDLRSAVRLEHDAVQLVLLVAQPGASGPPVLAEVRYRGQGQGVVRVASAVSERFDFASFLRPGEAFTASLTVNASAALCAVDLAVRGGRGEPVWARHEQLGCAICE